MQVSHAEDHVTHAIIGGEEKIEFGISNDASFYQILSSTLYSDQMLAVVREVLCNAWDAHIDAGITNKFLDVTLDDNTLVIKDFGLGIPKHLMGPVYATYGASTKSNDGKATGGFGLGCKAPFAYTDNFEVTSCHAGTKTVYRISKSSAEIEGKPGITPIVSVPTQETGLKVSINLKSASDRRRFEMLIMRIASNGGMKVMFNGHEIQPLPVDSMERGFLVTLQQVLENYAPICIRYGNVIYPLEAHKQYHDEYIHANRLVESRTAGGNWTLILQADPHTISVTPSRESLSMQDKTVVTVKGLLEKFNRLDFNAFENTCFEAAKERIDETLLEHGEQKVIAEFLKERDNYRRNNHASNYGVQNIFNMKDFARSFMETRYPTHAKFRRKDLLYRIQVLLWDKDTTLDKRVLVKFRDELLRFSTSPKTRQHGVVQDMRVRGWGKRHLVAPITLAMRDNPDLTADRFYAIHAESRWSSWVDNDDATVYSARALSKPDLTGYLQYMRKIVIITHSRNNIWRRVIRYPDQGSIFNDNVTGFVYHVPRIAKKVKAAREFFEKQGMKVVDLTAVIEYEEPGFSAKEKADKKAKKVGYPTLASSYSAERFQQDLIKSEDAERVEKPKFYTYLNARSSKYHDQRDLPSFPSESAKLVNRLWGKEGAAILSGAQGDKLEKEGVPCLEKFVKQQIINFFTDNKAIENWFGGSLKRVTELCGVSEATLTLFWNCPEMVKKFGLGGNLSLNDELMYSLFKKVLKHFGSPEYVAIQTKLNLLPLSQASVDLIAAIEASKTLKYVAKYDLLKDMNSPDPDTKTRAIRFLMQALKN